MWTAYFPVLARAHDEPREASRIAAEFTTLLAWMGLPVTALAWATGRHVVTLLYGPDFAQSGLYFEWLCLNIAVIFINTGLNVPLLAWGLQRMQVKITVPVGVAVLALSLVVIPRYGAWSTSPRPSRRMWPCSSCWLGHGGGSASAGTRCSGSSDHQCCARRR